MIFMTFMVFLVIAAAIVLYLVAIYNGLIRVKNNIKKSFANIDVLLKQRADELPKLVESVKGYMKHESGTLEKLTQARTQFLNAETVSQKAEASNMMTGALKSLFAVAENYPDLKANTNFNQLQSRISSIETEIADRREFYNDSVNTYNIRIQSIPDVFIARFMNLQAEEMFEATKEDRQDVEIKF